MEILSAVESGVHKPTRIMYKTGLSWAPTNRMLSSLIGQGLIRVREVEGNKKSRRRYEVTKKGLKVLRYFEEADELIRVIENP